MCKLLNMSESLFHLLEDDDIIYLVGSLGLSKEAYIKNLLVPHTQSGAGNL